ncbi:unnamed protein product [Thlaspi arvense]|uniref:S-locus receptor kinase C-terminal domain-containing protein n=1 Tax=Thlaspi arvense TaxID=13288 RepID=A0AAU9RM28_THLAR|nr:unnamed protein product [Thlaspi arvense]
MAELIRFALVALLCVQKCPEDRPIMSSVLLMLITETATLPQPKKPGFYAEWKPNVSDNLANKSACSTNEVSMTLLEPR